MLPCMKPLLLVILVAASLAASKPCPVASPADDAAALMSRRAEQAERLLVAEGIVEREGRRFFGLSCSEAGALGQTEFWRNAPYVPHAKQRAAFDMQIARELAFVRPGADASVVLVAASEADVDDMFDFVELWGQAGCLLARLAGLRRAGTSCDRQGGPSVFIVASPDSAAAAAATQALENVAPCGYALVPSLPVDEPFWRVAGRSPAERLEADSAHAATTQADAGPALDLMLFRTRPSRDQLASITTLLRAGGRINVLRFASAAGDSLGLLLDELDANGMDCFAIVGAAGDALIRVSGRRCWTTPLDAAARQHSFEIVCFSRALPGALALASRYNAGYAIPGQAMVPQFFLWLAVVFGALVALVTVCRVALTSVPPRITRHGARRAGTRQAGHGHTH